MNDFWAVAQNGKLSQRMHMGTFHMYIHAQVYPYVCTTLSPPFPELQPMPPATGHKPQVFSSRPSALSLQSKAPASGPLSLAHSLWPPAYGPQPMAPSL